LPNETLSEQRKREHSFPIDIFMAGLRVSLEQGEATSKKDVARILASFTQGTEHQLEQANCRLRSLFAKAVWPKALELGIVEDLDSSNPGTISLPEVLSADTRRTELSLSFASMRNVDSLALGSLARGLPESLKELQLSFADCYRVDDKAVLELMRGMPQGLRALSLDFLGCTSITDAGIGYLALGIPDQLTKLTLHFDGCNSITSSGLQALAEHIPRTVQDFNATFHGTVLNDAFTSVSDFRRAALPKTSSLARSFLLDGLTNLRVWHQG